MTITETDIQLTRKEKFTDFLKTSLLGKIIMTALTLIVFVLFPLLVPLVLIWENIVEKYWYKLTGKQRKLKHPVLKNPYSGLPISIDFRGCWLIDGCLDKMKEKFNMTDADIDDYQFIGQITTDPPITELQGKYFDPKTFVFNDKVFVQEVKLPGFKTSLGFIDCKNLKYEIIYDMDSYPSTIFTGNGDTLEITLRQPKLKKLIRIEDTATKKK